MDEDMDDDKNNNGDDNSMSQSLVSLSGLTYRRKRHPELTPVMPRERFFVCSASRVKSDNCSKSSTTDGELLRTSTTTPKRAVSMTRLDQLARPRRRYLEESLKALNSGNTNHLTNSNSNDSKAKSMSNLTNFKVTKATHLTPHRTLSPPLHSLLIRKGMFTSMTQLSAHERAKYSASNKLRTNNSSSFNTNKQLSKSMVQLSAKPTPPPRPTRASKLRTQLTPDSNVRESNLTSSIRSTSSALSPTEVTKDVVKMRAKPTVPRKPRPVTIGSFNVDLNSDGRETPNRGSRSTEKKVQSSQPTPALRSSRARSAGASLHKLSVASPDSDSSDFVSSTAKPTPPRKPAHVKAAAMAKKAVKQSDIIATSVDVIEVNGNGDQEIIDINGKEVLDANDKTDDNNKEEVIAEPVPLIEPKESETIKSPSVENSDTVMPSSKKEISEEDYKKMMAEKRKQAREQAEREAELERQRIENERLEELERQRKEEEEQKRLEEEQLRLLEEQKQLEEERLRKAVEESRIREEIETKRKEEEARARLEKEEKERKAKEESERQRIELEERLKKDEEERLARKKKLEAIMSRTRKTTPNARGSSPSNSPNETPEPQLSDSTGSSPEKMREEANNYQNILKNDIKDEQLVIIYK